VFVLAGLSDLADGLIARLYHQKSPLGAYLDPMADKLLMAAAFVALGIARIIPSWLTVVVLSRDVILVLGVLILRLADYPLVIRPSLWGKCTTTTQILTVLLVLVGKLWPLPVGLLPGCFYLTGALTVISGVHYIYRELARWELTLGNRHG
jgi:cardiolipin synthase